MDISVVVPLYNEEESIAELHAWIKRVMDENNFSYEVIFCNDGSTDHSWKVIEELAGKYPEVHGVCFRRNYGKSPALFCGFNRAEGDVVITMDADLQDNLSVVDGFLRKYTDGYEIVYGVRGSRKTDTKFKRFTAQTFYKMMKMLGVDLVYNAADCRLMSRRAVKQLGEYTEVNLFLRGVVPLIGLKSTTESYQRDKRVAGESKYSLKKMVSLSQ